MMSQLGESEEGSVGYLVLVEANHPPCGGLGLETPRENRNQLGTMLDSQLISREARIGNQLRELERAAKPRPLLVALDANRKVLAILAFERLMRRGGARRAAERRRLLAGREIFGQPRGL